MYFLHIQYKILYLENTYIMNHINDLKLQIENLKASIKAIDDEAERLSSMEQAVKIVLNGGYGALGNASFRWYDETIAEGITATGRVGIQYITKKINEFVNKMSDTIGMDYVVSSDTDSIFGEAILTTDIGEITIGDLYSQYTDESLELKTNKDSVRTLTQSIKSASFDGEKVVYNNISYIMKHHVKKRMYRVKVNGDYVDITEDHSIMIIRDNMMQSVKPVDVLKTDKFVRLITKS